MSRSLFYSRAWMATLAIILLVASLAVAVLWVDWADKGHLLICSRWSCRRWVRHRAGDLGQTPCGAVSIGAPRMRDVLA
ncbi:hypothetical protein ACQEVF_57020 [Nonomuraea polychroma]|uniref:hypothetical protein n=1 Tax=Nonomuraea polychroma TaxID=46176 RepID=UPI003D934071